MSYITDGLKHQFAKNIELVAQEKGKLRKLVQEEEIETEVAYFETMGNIEALARDRHDIPGAPQGYGLYTGNPGVDDKGQQILNPAYAPVLAETVLHFPQITRRQINAAAYYWTGTMDRNDKANLLADPTSKFPQMAGLAMARAIDRAIIRSIGSPVVSGLTGAGRINFNILDNVVPLGLMDKEGEKVGFDPEKDNFDPLDGIDIAPAKLTVEKLIMARRMLNQGTFNSDQKMYFVCTAQQLTDLLQDDKVVSGDYNSVKALVSGELKTFMGFEFIISELLTGITGPKDANVAAVGYSIRECFAFTEDAIRFVTVKGSSITKTDELPMKHYAPMLYHSQSFGAARASEGKVVIVKCLESYRADHTELNGWVVAVKAADIPQHEGGQDLPLIQKAAAQPERVLKASIIPANYYGSPWVKATYREHKGLVDILRAQQPMLAKKKILDL